MKGAKVAALLVALCLSHGAWAQERQFDLAAMDAVHGIPEFARQAGIQIVAPADDLGGIKTPAIHGNLDVRVALKKLLVGTELEIASDDGAVITLRRRANATKRSGSPDRPSAQQSTNAVRVGGPAMGDSGQLANALNLEEIIVTAQKKSERIQDVPVPVTAISASTLLDNNQLRLQDYFATVPGLNFTTDLNGQPFLSIRGITTGGGNPTVGVTVDNVPYGASSTYGGGTAPVPDIDPSDLARVEVLRGPQGTLYGASSLGGLLKYVTVDPSMDHFSGRVEADVNSVHDASNLGYAVRGAVNEPVSDAVAFRASGFARQDPGYIDNILTGEKSTNRVNVYGGHLSVLWRPSDDWSLKFSALFQDTKGYGAPTAIPSLGDLKQNNIPGTGSFHLQSQSYSITLGGHIGAAEFTAVSGFNIFSESGITDVSPSIGGGPPSAVYAAFGVTGVQQPSTVRSDKFSQEVRLTVPIGQSIDWLSGVFYTHETSRVTDLWFAENPSSGALVGNVVDAYWPTTFSEAAVFTNFTVHFTQRFDVQFGGRESQNRQTYSEVDGGGYTTVFGFPGAPAPLVTPEVDTKDNSFTYLVTPRYKVSDDFMLYARIASGYRAGGPNPTCSAFDIPCHFGPDKTTNYEIGAKGDTLDHRLSFDASVYYVDWKDIQLSVVAPCLCAQYFTNASRAKSEGAELSVTARPWLGATVGAWVDWNTAVLTQGFPPNSAVVAASGDRLPFSSRFSGSLSVEQEFPLWTGTRGYVGGLLSYVGKREGEFFFTPQRPNYPSYAQTDLRLGLQHDSWRFGFFAKNIADERGITGGTLPVPWAGLGYTYIQPRTIGVSVSRAF